MPWRFHRIWIVAVLLVSGLALAWLIAKTPLPQPAATMQPVATPTPDLTGSAIYTNGPYGFAITYPERAVVADAFASAHLPSSWRVNAIGEGNPIVSITTYATASEHAYPRHFEAVVRIGASTDVREVRECLRPTADRGETALPDATFGGATWKVFSFGDAGMQRYVRGESYRTVHEGACVAIERITAGSRYREGAHPDDVSEAVLEDAYGALDQVVKSFVFAR
ncbi:MAG TPA: hypothetical protein VEA36_01375 [Candidatus Paceibacterota bacterium]|nr:hypothetical protein [Candidatus Paceibacterota bacterium]